MAELADAQDSGCLARRLSLVPQMLPAVPKELGAVLLDRPRDRFAALAAALVISRCCAAYEPALASADCPC
jgi:hypothetical protein